METEKKTGWNKTSRTTTKQNNNELERKPSRARTKQNNHELEQTQDRTGRARHRTKTRQNNNETQAKHNEIAPGLK